MDNNELNKLFNNATLNMDDVSAMIMTMKKNKIKETHKYAITAPSGGSPYWRTYFKPEGGTRRKICGNSEDELLEKLITLYEDDSYANKLTFERLFNEWIEYKRPLCNSENTIKRHLQHFKKYFNDLDICRKSVGKINSIYLEKVCNQIIKKHNLTRKEWTNVKTIINGMFEYARRSGYITVNPMADVRITIKFRQITTKTSNTQVFNAEEMNNLIEYLTEMFDKTHDVGFIAVQLNFFLGLRVGELVALRPEDISENKIHVCREEVRNQSTGECEVVPHTKTNTDRYVTLITSAKELINKLTPREYLFERNGKRITARQYNYILEKYSQRKGIKNKASHIIRKTYASNLSAAGVPLECIREELGHTNLLTTTKYIFNPLTDEAKLNMINNALSKHKPA